MEKGESEGKKKRKEEERGGRRGERREGGGKGARKELCGGHGGAGRRGEGMSQWPKEAPSSHGARQLWGQAGPGSGGAEGAEPEVPHPTHS